MTEYLAPLHIFGGERVPKKKPVSTTRSKEKAKISLDGKSFPARLDVDNSSLQRELKITGPAGKAVIVTVENRQIYNSFSLSIPRSGKLSVPFAEILKHVPLGSQVNVVFYLGNSFRPFKRARIRRSAMEITPDPAKLTREITPLYQEIAEDLKAGKPLVINTHVVLWDSQFTGAGRGKNWAIGDKPETNLYWGGGYGVYRMFKRNRKWKLVKDGEKQAVFQRTYKPTKAWRDLGVTEPFKTYAVFNLHHAEDIEQGYASFARDLFGEKEQAISLDDGEVIRAGGQSRITGYIGHLNGTKPVQEAKTTLPSFKKGVFMTTCLSAQSYGDLVVDKNIYGLLFNSQFIAPEGYTFLSLFSAVARGGSGIRIKQQVRAAYQKYHQNVSIPGRFFVNSSRGLARFLFPYEGDQDKDEIPNRIDPQPMQKNTYEKAKNSIIIHLLDGSNLEILNP